MFTLSSSDKSEYLAFDENILKVGDKLSHIAASIFLDVDDCRQLASALLHGAESQILRQAITEAAAQAHADVLNAICRGDVE